MYSLLIDATDVVAVIVLLFDVNHSTMTVAKIKPSVSTPSIIPHRIGDEQCFTTVFSNDFLKRAHNLVHRFFYFNTRCFCLNLDWMLISIVIL